MAKAQESAICGDWIGVYEGIGLSNEVNEDGEKNLITKDIKAYLRIRIIDGHYNVRMKTRYADESKPFNYMPECCIEYADDHHITWVFDYGDDYDWSGKAKEQGNVIGHSHEILSCQIMLTNETLKYSDEHIITYYDKQGRRGMRKYPS